MKPLAKRITVLGGTFKIITENDDPTLVRAELDDKDVSAVCCRRQMIFVRSDMTLRAQWEAVMHEVTHIYDDETQDNIEEAIGHPAIYRLAAFWTDFLERNGFLDEPHRRGFFEITDEETQ